MAIRVMRSNAVHDSAIDRMAQGVVLAQLAR